ncbi:cytochrome P450 [Xylariaceae sp. FL0255]|nr:cytochrome P450 [Xylariaceae sp. FL0255]
MIQEKMAAGMIVIAATTLISLAIAKIILKKDTGLPRLGTSPGPLGLLTCFARWRWYKHGHENVRQRYDESKDANYVTQTMMGDTIVLAPRYLAELSMLPESKLSSTTALVDSVMGQYSGVDLLLQDHLSSDICRGPLRKKLPLFVPIMAKELEISMSEKLGQAGTAPVVCVAYDLLYSFIERVSSLVFVGRAHYDDEIWKNALTTLPGNVEITKLILLPIPSFLRSVIAPLIPHRNRIFRDRTAVRQVLFPNDPKQVITTDNDPSVLNLLIESGKDTDPASITARLLILNAAALHTSSMALTHAIFDLCARPEYVEPLRSEAREALMHSGGNWQLSTLQRLRRLDSFLKESQRMNHSTFLGFDRKVMSRIELSDGKTTLPTGAKIAVPGGPMSVDSSFYDRAQDFDGFRFYRPEDDEMKAPLNTNQTYTGIEPGNVSWGYGRFTCPGRWYADALIKLTMANLLLRYDISFPNGQTQRPSGTKYDTERHPDFEQRIVMTNHTID